MATIEYPFRFHPAFAAAALPFGVREHRCVVRVEDDRLEARYGPWSVSTPLTNVRSATVTGPYAWPKVVGGARVSVADRGLTFASNPDQGVCLEFVEPVRGADPLGLVRHPTLTVTVAEPAALAELLDRERSAGDAPAPTDLLRLVERTEDDLAGLSAADLRARARERGLTGVSRLSKAELLVRLAPPAVHEDGEAANEG